MNSEIVVINYHLWKELFEDKICWHKLLITILEKAFCKKEKREREFLLYNAQERYESFLTSYPNLENRIRQHVIASYLGITPVALSRLKNKNN